MKKINFVTFLDKNGLMAFDKLYESLSKNYKEEEYELYVGTDNVGLKKMDYLNSKTKRIHNECY